MTEFDTVNGYLWPKSDRGSRAVAFTEVAALERVYPLVTDWSCVVQAGGNCGVWANALAERFGTVYTFEPDPDNFHCLARNCTAPNIVKLQAALGRGIESPHDLEREPGNCGAHRLRGSGQIPVLALDHLNLPTLGLLYLDIEGYEPHALIGAKRTIERCRPVIAIEAKSLSIPYGFSPEALTALVLNMGYRREFRFANDNVFTPLP